MKRLITAIAILAAAFTSAHPAWAQSKDLAGSWVLDVDKSGTKDGPPMVFLTLTDKEFSARFGNETARQMTFKLDGTESTMPGGVTTKAAWHGAKLDATVTNPQGPDTVTFSRDGAWLVLESTRGGHGPMKLYFKKAPPKV